MKAIRTFLIFVQFISGCFIANSQTPQLDRSTITGIWKIESHLSVRKDTTFTLHYNDNAKTYYFNPDGLFVLKYNGEYSDYALTGNWKLSKNSRRIILYNNRMAFSDKSTTIKTKKQRIRIIEFTTSTFTTKEKFPGDVKPGLSVYKRVQ